MTSRLIRAPMGEAKRFISLANELPAIDVAPPPAAATAGLRLFDVRALGQPVYHHDSGETAEVAVIIPLYNYAVFIEECLESLLDQDLERFSVVVVDDCSSDGGGRLAIDILQRHAARFASATVIAHLRNQGVSMARNSAIAWCAHPCLFMLDADNRLRPPALSRLLDALLVSGAAFTYPQVFNFGDTRSMGVADIWSRERLRRGNYIDTMAMIRRDALLAAGGYGVLADDNGWEDYDLWCRFAVLGLEGVFLPEVLCEYRVHGNSRTGAQTASSYEALSAELTQRYPGLFVVKDDDEDD